MIFLSEDFSWKFDDFSRIPDTMGSIGFDIILAALIP